MVVLGVHLAAETHQDAARTTAKLHNVVDRQRGLSAVSPEVVRARVRGQGDQIIDQALTGHGRTLLAEGRLLFEQAELEVSLDRLSKSVASLESAMAGTTDSRPLVDALLLLGMVQLSMGDADEARRVYKKVLRLDPARELDTVHYPPKVVSLFQEVRAAVLAAPRASVSIWPSDPDARVYIDGRLRGQGNVLVDDLITGEHHVLVGSDSGHRSYTLVPVEPGSKKVVKAHLKRRFVGRAANDPAARSQQVAGLYQALGERVTSGVVLLGGQLDVQTVALQIFEPRTGNFSRILTAPSEGDPAKALVSLAAQTGSFLNESGLLRADQVGSATIPLDIGANTILAEVLLNTRSASADSGPSHTAPAASRTGQAKTPWYVWAGVGALTAGAAGVAFALQGDEGPVGTGGGGGKSTTSGTGTVVVPSP